MLYRIETAFQDATVSKRNIEVDSLKDLLRHIRNTLITEMDSPLAPGVSVLIKRLD